jgi:hypothetical protein
MLTSALIIVFSLVLLVYWFRYSCLLLLRQQTMQDSTVRNDSRFNFVSVKERLQRGEQLDPLHECLQRDYQILTYLLDHGTSLDAGGLEDRLLVLDYRLMEWWFRITRRMAPRQAREALSEMASILGVLVTKISGPGGLQNQA